VADPLPLTGERTLPGLPAENYWFQRHVAAYRFAAPLVGGQILDVGCGEGYGAAMLAARGRVSGFEYDPAAAAHAHASYRELSVAIADACHLPARHAAVDAVVAMQVLEHLYCADRFVSSCRTALRPGGVFVLSTPNRTTFSPEGMRNAFHVYEYSAEELQALLRVHFEDVRLYGLRHGAPLRARERLGGGSLPKELMATAYHELPAKRRALVDSVKPGDFRITPRGVDRSLDLVAVCRT
jgi:SAM-dependent methyltransferase